MKLEPPGNFDDLARSLFGWLPTNGWSIILGILGIVLVGLGLLVESHHYFPMENIPGFYGIFGFVAFSFAVLSGWTLRYLLSRNEKYYSDDEENHDG